MTNENAAKMAHALNLWARDIAMPIAMQTRELSREQYEMFCRAFLEDLDETVFATVPDAFRTPEIEDLLIKAVWKALWHCRFKLEVQGGSEAVGTA